MADQEQSIVLAELDAIPEGGSLEWRESAGDDRAIALFRRNGKVYAYRSICPHHERPLGLGRPGSELPRRYVFDSEQRLMCPHHGALFTVEDGLCVAGPCRGASLTALPVRVVEGKIHLLLGRADENA